VRPPPPCTPRWQPKSVLRYSFLFMQPLYFELYRMKTDRYFLRQKLVTYARIHGIKDTVRTSI